MLSASDTLWVLFALFVLMVWSLALEFIVLGLPDLAWSLKFLQYEWNVLNHLVIVLWLTVPLFFTQQMFLGTSMVL